MFPPICFALTKTPSIGPLLSEVTTPAKTGCGSERAGLQNSVTKRLANTRSITSEGRGFFLMLASRL
jgi:hypothetical protein